MVRQGAAAITSLPSSFGVQRRLGADFGGSPGQGCDVVLGLPVGFLLGVLLDLASVEVLEGGLQGLAGVHWLGSPE